MGIIGAIGETTIRNDESFKKILRVRNPLITRGLFTQNKLSALI
jgi:hypothetical protein